MRRRWGGRILQLSTIVLITGGAAFGQSLSPQPGTPTKEAADCFNAGCKLLNQNRTKEATDKFRQAVALSPEWAEAHGNLGTALVMQGDTPAALSELETAVKLKPTAAPAWATLGSCYQALGKTKEAVDALNRYLKLDPEGELAPKVRSLAAALESEMKRTRGVNDLGQKDYLNEAVLGGLARWTTAEIKIYIKPGDDVIGYRPEYVDYLKQALSDWEQNSKGRLHFAYVNQPFGAQILCSWTDTTKDGVSAAEGGHTVLVPDGHGAIVTANMTLLTVPIQGRVLSSEYARRVDLHEVGHALGIMGHSKDPNDVMFTSIVPGAKPVLTERDINTLLALYSDEAVKIAGPGIDPTKLVTGDPSTKLNQVISLNNQAKMLLDKGNIAGAVEKMESAHSLDPNNAIVCTNLGSVYGNMAAICMKVRNFGQADAYFKKAIPLLEHGTNNINLGAVLQNYSKLLQMTNRAPEAARIEAQLKAMGGG